MKWQLLIIIVGVVLMTNLASAVWWNPSTWFTSVAPDLSGAEVTQPTESSGLCKPVTCKPTDLSCLPKICPPRVLSPAKVNYDGTTIAVYKLDTGDFYNGFGTASISKTTSKEIKFGATDTSGGSYKYTVQADNLTYYNIKGTYRPYPSFFTNENPRTQYRFNDICDKKGAYCEWGIDEGTGWVTFKSDGNIDPVIIVVVDAEHLDEDKDFIENIYNYVKAKDYNFSLIDENHFAKILFEKNLTNVSRIDFNANSSATSTVEVYDYKFDKLGSFNISQYNTYGFTTGALNLTSSSLFYLKVLGAEVYFDYIVDPAFCYGAVSACSDLTEESLCEQSIWGCGMNAWHGCYGTISNCGSVLISGVCETVGCHWGACDGSSFNCVDISDANICTNKGCSWDYCTGNADCSGLSASECADYSPTCSWNGGSCDTVGACTDMDTNPPCVYGMSGTSPAIGCDWGVNPPFCTDPASVGPFECWTMSGSDCLFITSGCMPQETSKCIPSTSPPTEDACAILVAPLGQAEGDCEGISTECVWETVKVSSEGCTGTIGNTDCNQSFMDYPTCTTYTSSKCSWDSTLPYITTTAPPASKVYKIGASIPFNASIQEDNLERVWGMIDSSTRIYLECSGTKPYYGCNTSDSSIPAGDHYVMYYANDSGGQEAYDNPRAFYVDETPPTVVISSPVGYYNNYSVVNELLVTPYDNYDIDSCWYTNTSMMSNSTPKDFSSSGTDDLPISQADLRYTWNNFTVWCNDSVGYLGVANVTFGYDIVVPNVTFNYQIPADLNLSNFIGQAGLNISYNATDDFAGIDPTQSNLFYKSNSTQTNVMYWQNGTSYSGYFSLTPTGSTPFIWNFKDNNILTGTYNYGEVTLENTVHLNSSLSSNNQYLSVELLNVSSTSQYGFFEIMANRSSGTGGLNFWYCNSTYNFASNPITSPNCMQYYTLTNDTYNHVHTVFSSHVVIPFAVNTTLGQIGNVKVTSKSNFLMRGQGGSTWKYYYIAPGSRANAMRTTTNNGIAWTSQTYTVDSHLHQFGTNYSIWYYFCGKDKLGNLNCTSIRQDNFELGQLPPDAPFVYSPTNDTYYKSQGILPINYSASTSPNGYTIYMYNISLLNTDYSWNLSINTNNSNLLGYNWNVLSVTNGSYIIRVEACDTLNQCSFGYSERFALDNYPTVSAGITAAITGKCGNLDTIYCDWTIYSNEELYQ